MGKIVLEDFNEGNGYYKVNLAYLNNEQVEEIENLVSKWNPTDEDIKSSIRMCLTGVNEQRFKDYNTNLKECLAWLEKQDGQKSKKASLWKHWKNGILGNGEGKLIYLVKEGNTYRLTSCLGFECDYIELSELDSLLFEKQGEQRSTDKDEPTDYNSIDPCFGKPIDKCEPKFKVGDWVVWKGESYKVCYNGYGYELIDQNDLSTSLEYSTVDENARFWTIQDAKPGDVIIDKSGSRECPFIFKETKPSDIKTDMLNPLTVLGYCGIGGAGFTKGSGWGDTANCIYYPATKEQREFLFQKMKETGYEWDAEKKELKKIEQTSDWSEEDEDTIKFLISHFCVYHYNTTFQFTSNKLITHDELLEKIRNLRPQNRCTYNPYKEVVESIAEMCKHYDKVTDLQDFYDNVKVKCKDAKEYDSLFPQNTWKPSKEQMGALANACDGKILNLDYLNSLYQDLKKLREE